MDIFQRTCKREGVFIEELKENEIEILDAESCEEENVEEEETLEEELDFKLLQHELDCMKRRIQQLQLKLKMMHMSECPEEECVDFEVELNCSENKEICRLQKNQHKLQCQINELIRCCKLAKDMIADLRLRMCEKTREVAELQKLVAKLISWRNTLEHEFGVCIERFEYLKHVKAEWKDVEALMDQQKQCQAKMADKFVPKHCFVDEKKQFVKEINDLKDMFKELFELHMERFYNLEQRLNNSLVAHVMYDGMEEQSAETAMQSSITIKSQSNV